MRKKRIPVFQANPRALVARQRVFGPKVGTGSPKRSQGHSCPKSDSIKVCWDSCASCRRFHGGREVIAVPSYIFNDTISIKAMRAAE